MTRTLTPTEVAALRAALCERDAAERHAQDARAAANRYIRDLRAQGRSLAALGRIASVTPQRIQQIARADS